MLETTQERLNLICIIKFSLKNDIVQSQQIQSFWGS
jgi:hypothetical protein